ncbi:MAG: hypothetical protein ACRDJE_19590 [Dehalococcoidia bacterium]
MDATRWGNRLRTRPTSGTGRPPIAPAAPADPAWQLLLRTLVELGGFERTLFYDVPRAEAPVPQAGTRVFLRGSPAWGRYLSARALADDGELTLLLSLRLLADGERRLAVDWGNSHANAFLLVEPTDPTCDLTDPENALRRSLEAAARTLLRDRGPDSTPALPWTKETPLAATLRRVYGAWIAWPEPYTEASPEPIPLTTADPEGALRRRLLDEVARRYPQASFDDALAGLYERERELFGGPVARTRLPFLTRLGLPVLYNPRRVDHALRRLVNEGRAWVFEDGPDPAFYHGPQRPVPDRMTDAEFERLLVR